MGLLDKLFGNTVKKVAEEVIKDEAKKDPNIGDKLNRLDKMIKEVEEDTKGMTKAQEDKYHRDLWKKAGI
tara:strand:- start:311 stop:520 length:210 start_codon:yes stop_codon:yes gene_type:complete